MIAASIFVDLMDAWQQSADSFWPQLAVFLSMTVRSLGLALLLGIPIALILTRLPKLAPPIIATLALLQTIPSLVLLALCIPLLAPFGMGIGQPPALIAAVVYSLFPIVMNTYVGITQVPPSIRDAARGMGMTGRQILWNVELPLAFPVVLAGVRTGAIYASAMIVIGSFIGAGGLGDYIFNGLNRADNGLLLVGTIPILLLTLLLFWGLGGLAQLSKRSSSLGMSLGGSLIVVFSLFAAYGVADQILRPRRADVVIGAKNFTEGQILSQIMRLSIEDGTRLSVDIKSNLGPSLVMKFLKTGEIDLYPEYTGNLLTSKEALDLPVPGDRSTITGLVRQEMRRRFGLVFMEPFGLNNTYAPSVTEETARRYRLRNISDLQRVPQLRVVIDLSFLTRPDGWKGLVEKYDLHFNEPPRQVSPDLLYRALEQQQADLVIGFATDWQITAQKLVVLADDRGYFPSYHAAPLVRETVLNRYPEVGAALGRLANKINDDTMRQMNYQVAVEHRSEEEVAREFLRKLSGSE
jgi:osmoprotectant transport system permease protein